MSLLTSPGAEELVSSYMIRLAFRLGVKSIRAVALAVTASKGVSRDQELVEDQSDAPDTEQSSTTNDDSDNGEQSDDNGSEEGDDNDDADKANDERLKKLDSQDENKSESKKQREKYKKMGEETGQPDRPRARRVVVFRLHRAFADRVGVALGVTKPGDLHAAVIEDSVLVGRWTVGAVVVLEPDSA